MNSRILAAQQLIDARACSGQVDLFRQTFGDSVAVTVDLAKKHASQFSFQWAGDNLLSSRAKDVFASKSKPLYDEYDAKLKPLIDEYDAKRKLLYDDYRAKRKLLIDDYRAKLAELWAEAYINDTEEST